MYAGNDIQDADDFWSGYDDEPSPALLKSSFTHFEYSPSTSSMTAATAQPLVPAISFALSPSTSTSTNGSLPSELSQSTSSDSDDGGDDSYWKQYTAVQGSGDSTVPSPRLPKRELDVPSSMPAELQPYIEYGSLRKDPYIEGAFGVEEEFAEDQYGRGHDDAFAIHVKEPLTLVLDDTEPTLSRGSPVSPVISDLSSASEHSNAADDALETAVREVYRLWLRENKDGPVDEFLAVVRRAIISE